MNQSYQRVNAPHAYAHVRVKCSEYNCTNIIHALLGCILRILYSDWPQRARSVRGVYEFLTIVCFEKKNEPTHEIGTSQVV